MSQDRSAARAGTRFCRRGFALGGAILGLAMTATGCAATSTASTSVTLTVFAASSLTASFTQLGTQFEAAHPGTKVTFSFDGSSTLVDQLVAGAPADVLATADEATMTRATKANAASNPQKFASNVLILIVPPGNPAKITGLDASLSGKKLVVCAPPVPCGATTKKLATMLGITLQPVSEESKVTDVRAKVETGQADAGLVFTTDATAAGTKVQTIPIPGAEKAPTTYVIATTTAAKQPTLAKQFVEYVTGPDGQAALKTAGFGP